MTDRELFKETFSHLHASEDTVTEVMKMVRKQKYSKRSHQAEHKKGRMSARTGALIALAAVLLMTTALASEELTGFFSARLTASSQETAADVALAVYGDGSISSVAPVMKDSQGNELDTAEMERVSVDEETAVALVGDYTADVEATVTLGDNTYTFESFLLDENGMGMLTYTISNPNGVTGWYDAGYGQICFGEDSELYDLVVYSEENGTIRYYDSRAYLLSDVSTDTELHIVTYMVSGKDYEPGENLYIRLWYNAEGNKRIEGKIEDVREETIVSVTPVSYIPTATLTDGEGHQVSLSSVGMIIGWHSDHELSCHEVVIHYTDGTEYVVKSDEYYNALVAYWQTGTNIYENACYVFNRLVDVSQVASVTVTGIMDTDGEGSLEDVSFTVEP